MCWFVVYCVCFDLLGVVKPEFVVVVLLRLIAFQVCFSV